MKKILGLGNALTDILFHVSNGDVLSLGLSKGSMNLISFQQAIAIQEQFAESRKSMIAGGSASNTINAIASLGGVASFIGKVGNDEIGRFFRQDTLRNGVTDPCFLPSDLLSGCCNVLMTPDGERTFCTCLGAAGDFREEDLQPAMFSGYDIFHIEGYIVQNHAVIEKAMRLAKNAGLTVSLDLASFNVVNEHKAFLKDLVARYVDIIFANEDEALAYTGCEPEDALEVLAKECKTAVVKVGKHGSLVQRGEETYHVPAVCTQCVDSTGAGDYYAAGFLYGLASGMSLRDSAQLGTLTAGRVCEVVGAKLPEETWQEVRGLCALMHAASAAETAASEAMNS